MPVEKELSPYYDESNVDPDSPDIELEIGDGFDTDSNVMEMEDGSAIIGGGTDEDPELPPMDQIPHTANLVAYFEDSELTEIASKTTSAYETDNESRKDWRDTYIKGLDLLGMKIESRDEPFPGASGVHHPLLAEAVVQFQAQAYKELLPAGGPVSTKVLGSEDKARVAQAERVKDFLNYLIVDVMEEYDSDMDQLLFNLPLAGSAFKKTYFDPVKERTVSKFVSADHITVPYNSTNLQDTPRIIHDFVMPGNTVLKYQENGFYTDAHIPKPGTPEQSEVEEKEAELSGLTMTDFEHDEDYTMLESHQNLDHELLISPKGVALPYIVTLDKDSGTVLSIRRNYKEGDPLYNRLDHFTHYKFLPGLGFYGFGLIHMIGGLTASATSILRQLIDAGSFATLQGGFKAKGMRIDGEDSPLEPGEFRDVDSPGGMIKEAIMALPYKEPSATLAMLLGNLVESGQRFASIADMQVGDTSGQQQPVGTTVAMLERGTKVMSSIHKRLHKAQKHEFKILARLVHESLPEDQPYPYATQGSAGEIVKADFDDRVDVVPVSDPNIFSMAQRIMLASQQLQMAQAAPELHNGKEAYRRMYVAMGVDEVETLLKPDEEPQVLTPMQEHRNVFKNKKLEPLEQMNHEAHLQAHLTFLKHPALKENFEFGSNLIQDIMGHIGFMAKKEAEKTGADVMQIEAILFEEILPQITPPQQPDPTIQLQHKQLDNKATDDKEKNAIKVEDIASKERIADNKTEGDMIKVDINERIAKAKEKLGGINRNTNN